MEDFTERILTIAAAPDSIPTARALEIFGFCCANDSSHIVGQRPHSFGPVVAIHSSILQSYQCLEFVKEQLARGVPGDVVLGLISLIENLAGEKTKGDTK